MRQQLSSKVLFISHDANPTGAPRSLFFFLKWLKLNSDINFISLLKDGGNLETLFLELELIGIFNKQPRFRKKLFSILHSKLHLQRLIDLTNKRKIKRKLLHQDIKLIYSNTVVNGDVLEFLGKFINCPVICHVRELENMIANNIGTPIFDKTQKYTNHYIAVSQAVKDNLVSQHSIPENHISVVYNSVPDTIFTIDREVCRHNLLQELGVPITSMLVCASGTTDWRKGPDLFIQLALCISKRNTRCPVHFVWVGGNPLSAEFIQLLYEVEKAGLSGKVHFMGSRSTPFEYYAACDIFALTSREDPFPRVCLEAASLAKPIVCFDQAGGAKEFVGNDCGFVVPFLDINQMADKLICLLEDSDLRERMGKQALDKVREHHTADIIGRQLLEIIKTFI